MSFLFVPSQLRVPQMPYDSCLPEFLWCGQGRDKGRYAFQPKWSDWGSYVMTDGVFVPSLRFDGREFLPQYSTINGYIWWTDTASRWIYNSLTCGWVVMIGKFAGYEPLEENLEYDEETGRYTAEGDDFWSFAGPPYRPGLKTDVVGRGSNCGKESKTMTVFWKRWTCGTEFGVYEPQDGALGNRVLGVPRFRGSNGEWFTRSYAKTKGRFTYGRIHYDSDNGKWVIGTVGADAGWHEGDEPQVGSSVTFKFCRNEDSEVEGTDIEVSYRDHVKGDEKYTGFIGEVAVWR